MCTTNEDHMIYGSWNIRCNRQKFWTFWAIFCSFSPLTTWKIKILTLKKDTWRYHFYIFAPKMTVIWCMVPEIWSVTDIFSSFWTVFCPFTPLPMNPENHFTNINNSYMMYGSSDMESNGQNFLSFWTVSCSFTPLTTQKMKILKKWKNFLEISFYTGVT